MFAKSFAGCWSYIKMYIIDRVAKPIVWVGTALEDLRAFPDKARSRAGYQLQRVQTGQAPNDWKPMGSVGAGVCEIRVHTDHEHRVFYVAKYDDAVSVLHAFEKRTRKTRAADIALARQRLRQIPRLRAEGKNEP